jgi:hypothetical protein
MMANPKVGQTVQAWYKKSLSDYMPYHGKFGRVVIASKGKPRNHGVEIDGQMIVIPCGNLRKVEVQP